MTEVKTPLGDGALELIKSMLEELKKGFTVTSRGDDIFEIIDIQAENLHHLMTEAYQAKAVIQRVREAINQVIHYNGNQAGYVNKEESLQCLYAVKMAQDILKVLDGEIGSVEPVKLEALDGEQ